MRILRRVRRAVTWWTVFWLFSAVVYAQDSPPVEKLSLNSVTIPRVGRVPKLEDFLEMKPSPEWEGKLAKVSGFIQRDPVDGAPATQATDVYLGYDQKNLYVIFVCFDSDAKSIRARLTRREAIDSLDDEVQIYLDTFQDHRRSYGFMINPVGVQFDYLWVEPSGYDASFDTVWDSAGKVTAQGYVGWMAIPFKSLRFPHTAQQSWGILLQRIIPRTSENLFWPKVTQRISGRLNQEGTARGLENVQPGRNMQFIPYGVMRTFRAPDLRDPAAPHFDSARAQGRIGLDSKFVLLDSLVLDTTINPDFSQVESDEPQITVNQRFEVFFPEKRPFFIENSDYFTTPLQLLFTRRIGDPSAGVRLTGKKGRYTLAGLFADDRAPGLAVSDADPLHHKRAYFGVFRATRDLFKEGRIGLMYTERQFQGTYNRVGSLDGRLKFAKNYSLDFQGVASGTRLPNGTHLAGPAYYAYFARNSLKFNFNTMYRDISPGFFTEAGFVNRVDYRRFSNDVFYNFRPKSKLVVSHGPELFQQLGWDHNGVRLDNIWNLVYHLNLIRSSTIAPGIVVAQTRLRPVDFPSLPADRDYSTVRATLFFQMAHFNAFTVFGEYDRGRDLNFVPASGPPVLANIDSAQLTVSIKGVPRLTVDNSYLLSRVRDRLTGSSAFNNHIIRSKWNYQFTRAFSLRFIAQYDTLLANPNFTALPTRKGFNADVLFTYLVHPGTAVYLGYNSNLTNPDLTFAGPGPAPNRFTNDGRQVFVKVSYLLRR